MEKIKNLEQARKYAQKITTNTKMDQFNSGDPTISLSLLWQSKDEKNYLGVANSFVAASEKSMGAASSNLGKVIFKYG